MRACCRSCSSRSASSSRRSARAPRPRARCSRHPRWPSPRAPASRRCLMAIMAGNGALAGTLSPFAPTGVVAHGDMEAHRPRRLRVVDVHVQRARARARRLRRLPAARRLEAVPARRRHAPTRPRSRKPSRWTTQHWLTAAGIVALIVAVAGFELERRHGRAHRCVGADPAARGRRVEGHRAHAVGRDRHGDGRDGADRAAAEDRRPGADHDRHREPVDAGHDRADRGVRRRDRLGLQQHVGRRAAGVPADGARSRACGSAVSIRCRSPGR